MRIQPTFIETLDRAHPGLRQDVDFALDAGDWLAPIVAMLKGRWGVDVSEKLVSNYKQKRWLPAVERSRRLREERGALLAVIKEHGADEFTEGFILERLDNAMQRGVEVSPAVLLREQRERTKLDMERQRIELEREQHETEKKLLELKIQQFRQQRQEIAAKAERVIKAQKGKKGLLAPETLEEIKGIYGLATAEPKPAQGSAQQ